MSKGFISSSSCCWEHTNLFFRGLNLFLVGNSSWQVSHGSVTSDTLGSPITPRALPPVSSNGLSGPHVLSWLSHSKSSVMHCPILSWTYGGRFHDSFTQASFQTLKEAPQGWHCQVQLPAWDGPRPPYATLTAPSVFCCFTGA